MKLQFKPIDMPHTHKKLVACFEKGINEKILVALCEKFPGMSGFSPLSFNCMQQFAESIPDPIIVQLTVAQLQWRKLFRAVFPDGSFTSSHEKTTCLKSSNCLRQAQM